MFTKLLAGDQPHWNHHCCGICCGIVVESGWAGICCGMCVEYVWNSCGIYSGIDCGIWYGICCGIFGQLLVAFWFRYGCCPAFWLFAFCRGDCAPTNALCCGICYGICCGICCVICCGVFGQQGIAF
jgi:hypothetical protein